MHVKNQASGFTSLSLIYFPISPRSLQSIPIMDKSTFFLGPVSSMRNQLICRDQLVLNLSFLPSLPYHQTHNNFNQQYHRLQLSVVQNHNILSSITTYVYGCSVTTPIINSLPHKLSSGHQARSLRLPWGDQSKSFSILAHSLPSIFGFRKFPEIKAICLHKYGGFS